MSSLSGTRLAKSICAQFRSRVTSSHETFLAAIKQLEMRHSGRLKESEGQRDTIRKVGGEGGGEGGSLQCTSMYVCLRHMLYC